MRTKSSVAILLFGATLLVGGGCDKKNPNPLAPDPGQPQERCLNPEATNYGGPVPCRYPAPPPAPTWDFTSPDGLVKMKFHKSDPPVDGVVRAGKPALVWMALDNIANPNKVTLCHSVVDGPDDNPGRPGRRTAIFGGCRSVEAGQKNENFAVGFSVGDGEAVPYLRESFFYNDSQRRDEDDPLYVWNLRLGWKPQS